MKIEIPTECPCCAYPLVFVKDQLFCRNTACDAQLNKKIEHFCKTLGIKGMGAKTIEKLELGDITELFYLDREYVAEAIGSEKVTDKLLSEIENAKQADLATVLASFSIPLVGSTASKKLCSVVSNIDEITFETCKKAGLGEKATANIISWLETEFSAMKEFLPFSFKANTSISDAVLPTVCVTGKLITFKTKKEAYQALESAGYKVVESVTKTTNYLVDEENKGSAKRKKAEQLGIDIILDLNTFLNSKREIHD